MADDVQKWTGSTSSGAVPKTAARLCNFETGQHHLREAHKAYLRDEVVKVLATLQGPWIDLHGFASRLGDPTFNQQLSERRVHAVRDFIAAEAGKIGKKPQFQISVGYGEAKSGENENDNSGYYRAVEVFVFATRPPPRPRIPRMTIPSVQFEIRLVGGGSASVIGQADYYFFQITNARLRQTAFFFYTGGGVGLSLPKIPGPGSMSYAGPVTQFRTSSHTELHMFNSKAELIQQPGVTVGGVSLGGKFGLKLMSIWDGTRIITTTPDPLMIEGGKGLQMPGLGSRTKGVLALASEVWPFTGY
jgi:hypothetical protein